MQDLGNTQFFRVETDNNSVKMILDEVYHALTEKGYNPVNQIVGYIMSGDPKLPQCKKSYHEGGER